MKLISLDICSLLGSDKQTKRNSSRWFNRRSWFHSPANFFLFAVIALSGESSVSGRGGARGARFLHRIPRPRSKIICRNDENSPFVAIGEKETLGGMWNSILFATSHRRLSSRLGPLRSWKKNHRERTVYVCRSCYCTIENKTITLQINRAKYQLLFAETASPWGLRQSIPGPEHPGIWLIFIIIMFMKSSLMPALNY